MIILLSGALQLIPLIQRRAPLFIAGMDGFYFVTAFAVSLAGLYMMWFRGTVGDLFQHLGQSLDAVLIMLCAAMALRYALMRNFKLIAAGLFAYFWWWAHPCSSGQEYSSRSSLITVPSVSVRLR